MTDLCAYGLRAEYDGTVETDLGDGAVTVPKFSGGVLAVAGEDFNVREELDAGEGVIVVDAANVALVNALEEYPALKRVAVTPDLEQRHAAAGDGRSVRELKTALKALEQPVSGTRAELLARLADAEAAAADTDTGDAGVAGQPDENAGAAGTDERQGA